MSHQREATAMTFFYFLLIVLFYTFAHVYITTQLSACVLQDILCIRLFGCTEYV